MTKKLVRHAQPGSRAAKEAGHFETGCYYVVTADLETGRTVAPAFASIVEAEAHADTLPGDWGRSYTSHPLWGSRFCRNAAVWADTHEGRVKQWQDLCARHNARKTLAQLRKGWFGSSAPRYVATFTDGSTVRVSFWQAKGKPYDFARGRKVAIGTSGRTIVRGHVEHEIPGQAPVRIEDPMTDSQAKAVAPSYRAVLEALVSAIEQGGPGSPAVASAYGAALERLGRTRMAVAA